MYLFERILQAVRRRFQRAPRGFQLSVETLRSLETLAERSQRTPEEIASLLLTDAMQKQELYAQSWALWQSLTPREQEVAALVCHHYTTRQIAAKLHISPETVKTHVEHILEKFHISDRNMLRVMLSDWDFSAWNR
jgi:DNA-binding CsgD family transcriptional regulator